MAIPTTSCLSKVNDSATRAGEKERVFSELALCSIWINAFVSGDLWGRYSGFHLSNEGNSNLLLFWIITLMIGKTLAPLSQKAKTNRCLSTHVFLHLR